MKKDPLDYKWLKSAVIRAIRTFAQSALSFITVGMAMQEINWNMVISISFVAAIYSILTSVVSLPPESQE